MYTASLSVRYAVFMAGLWLFNATAEATFHFMQIEQVIGGVNGDVTAQAIQLRQRAAGQNFVSIARVVVRNASGGSPVTVVDMTTDVPNGQAGRRILIASNAFLSQTAPATQPDFIMTNLIPASYLNAGSLTFEDDFGTIYWRLSWGGAAYTGPGTGSITNDADGNFNPPFGGPLPSSTNQALQFTGAASALSTNNAAQYAVTPGAAVFTNNANAAFTVMSQPMGACCAAIGGCAVTTQVLCIGEYLGDGTNCHPPACLPPISIIGSSPPNNAIDARQPSNLATGCSEAQGVHIITLQFDGDAESLTADDFEITTVPPGGELVVAAVNTTGDSAQVVLDGPIPVGFWTVITHLDSGSSVRVGYLPGDVNNDRIASPVDILRLIDRLNNVCAGENPPCAYADYQTDIDRSGQTTPSDILRVIDLLNGADCYAAYNGMTLPE